MYSGTKLSEPVTINGRTYPGGGNTPVATLSGIRKTLEAQLEGLNLELSEFGPNLNHVGARAENHLQIQKKEILAKLEEIETQELQAAGVLPMPKSGGGDTEAMNAFLGDVFDEMLSATDKYGGFNSAHEAYGVILEELDEFWDEVKKKRSKRDTKNMRRELVQTAAMCMKAAISLGL